MVITFLLKKAKKKKKNRYIFSQNCSFKNQMFICNASIFEMLLHTDLLTDIYCKLGGMAELLQLIWIHLNPGLFMGVGHSVVNLI